jgi:hypothetical protein
MANCLGGARTRLLEQPYDRRKTMRSTLLVTIAASTLSLALLGGASAEPRIQGYDWGEHQAGGTVGYGWAPRTVYRAPAHDQNGQMSPGPGYSWGWSYGPGQ